MSNEIKNNKGAVIKEVNGVKYFKLVSNYPGDYTKNCGLLANEIDENFYFLRSYDIESMHFNDENQLVLKRVDGDVIVATLPDLPAILFEKLKFEFDKSTGELIVTYPDGTEVVLDGFMVAGEEIKVATDFTIRGDGRISNPLRLNEVEKTGTYAPAKYFLDRTDGTPMPEGNQHGKGFRIVTKENFTPFGKLYTYDGIEKIKESLESVNSPWRIPSKEDWDELLNAAEYCDEDRNHDKVGVNEFSGKYAGGRAKSTSSWKLSDGELLSYDNLPTTGSQETFHIIPIGYGEGSRGVLTEEWDDDIEGLTQIASYWTDTPTGSKFKTENPNIFTRSFVYDTTQALLESSKPSSRLSLRLVKDYTYDCMDFSEYDYILGDAVPTVLISNPDVNYSKIWTSINIGFANPEYSGVTSSDWSTLSGEDREIKEVFYINEWNGQEWVKKQMRPGDSVVIIDYDNDPSTSGDTYHEWRVYDNGDGTSVLIDTAEALKEEFQKELDEIHEEIDNEIARAESAETVLAEAIEDVDEKVEDEIARAQSAETIIEESLNNEIARAESAETVLAEAIEDVDEKVESIEIVSAETPSSGILASYILNVDGVQHGIRIDVPKDDVQVFHEIKLGHSGATIDPVTGEITDGPYTDHEVLLMSYINSEKVYQLIEIDLEGIIIENEFEDGLEVEGHIVKVKIDPTSEGYLTVSPDGVKLSGITELAGDVEELSASTIAEVARLDGQDVAVNGHQLSLTDGLTLVRNNDEEIKVNIDTNFGLLPNYD